MTAKVITLRPRAERLRGEGGRTGRPVTVQALVLERDEDASWKANAACHGMTDVFFPSRGESIAEAREICRRCPVTRECLDYAMRHNEKFGVWSGTSERQRRRMRRQRAARS